jgi:hypothetical protein
MSTDIHEPPSLAALHIALRAAQLAHGRRPTLETRRALERARADVRTGRVRRVDAGEHCREVTR